MKTYIARRLLALIPVALVVATVAFVLIHLAPGDPASVIAGPDAAPEDVRKIEQQLGLDRPLPVQLLQWYGQLLQGDLGRSIFLRKPVSFQELAGAVRTLLARRPPPSPLPLGGSPATSEGTRTERLTCEGRIGTDGIDARPASRR